jgi:hypothetical protein
MQFENLVYLLNQGLHQSLVPALTDPCPDHLRMCLLVIHQLFSRLS